MRVDGVQLAGFDERGNDSPVFRPCVVTGEERVFPAQGDGADSAFYGIVVQFDATVCQEQAEAVPVFCDVFQGLAQGRFG